LYKRIKKDKMIVIIMESIHYILKAEKIFKKAGFKEFEIIPVPKEIHSNCGSALKIEKKFKDKAIEILKKNNLKFRIFIYDKNLDFFIEEENA